MRLTDNKKWRNNKTRKEKYFRTRDKRENELGVEIGHYDMNGTPIKTGDFVLYADFSSYSGHSVYPCSCLYWKEGDCYALMYGCWYKDKTLSDPESYGKVDFEFRNHINHPDMLVVGSMNGKRKHDENLFKSLYDRKDEIYDEVFPFEFKLRDLKVAARCRIGAEMPFKDRNGRDVECGSILISHGDHGIVNNICVCLFDSEDIEFVLMDGYLGDESPYGEETYFYANYRTVREKIDYDNYNLGDTRQDLEVIGKITCRMKDDVPLLEKLYKERVECNETA